MAPVAVTGDCGYIGIVRRPLIWGGKEPSFHLSFKLDALVLGALAEKAFTPKRVKGMLQKLKDGLKRAKT